MYRILGTFLDLFRGILGQAGKRENAYIYQVFRSFSPLLRVIAASGSGTHFGVSFWTRFGTAVGACGGGGVTT